MTEEMQLVHHKFCGHKIHPDTETLIIGTFNPETRDNSADFFIAAEEITCGDFCLLR